MKTDLMQGRNDLLFLNAFFDALIETMTEACGFQWSVTTSSDEDVTGAESEPVQIKLTFAGDLCGELLLEFDRSEASMLVSKLLRSPVSEFGEEEIEAVRALTEKASSAFSRARKQDCGVFTIIVSLDTSSVSGGTNTVRRLATCDEGNRLFVLMRLDSALTESLSIHCHIGDAVADAGKTMDCPIEKRIPEPVNLDLVMDVELNVTLRFGKRHLTLREVLELTSGSVVELDRQVDEPVELLLNGKVIAKGEAVVIDGNYGLRVSEVLQPVSSLILR